MYDFLDKIGLKAVLEAVKGKIPTSLPANGGNADTLDNLHADDFARSYNYDLIKYLNGQSGDIRDLVYQLPIGEYAINTTDSEFSKITFPIHGYCLMSWFPFKARVNDFVYGTLIIRSMYSFGVTYICSVYNTHSYSEWEEISTTPIYSTTVAASTDNYGNALLWSVSDDRIPISAYSTVSTNHICTPFTGGVNAANWYLAVDNALTHDAFANTSTTFTVLYIRK